jgi:hypothetical protein
MSDRLHMIVTDMADYLDPAALKTIILNDIPEHQERVVYAGESHSRPGWPRSGSRGRAITIQSHEEAYIAEFPDDETLQYLDLVRQVVLAQNPPKNAETRAFLFEEYATYSTKMSVDPPPSSDTGANPPAMMAAMRAMLFGP